MGGGRETAEGRKSGRSEEPKRQDGRSGRYGRGGPYYAEGYEGQAMKITSTLKMTGALLTGRPSEVVRDNQVAAMHEATQLASRRVKEKTPQGVMGAQGGLLSSIQPEVREISKGVLGIVATASPYGLVREKGRQPGKGMPPGGKGSKERPLVRWIEVKMGVTREEAERIEYPVRRKIAQKGTEGAHMFERTLDEDWGEFQNIFDRYGVTIARGLSK